MEVMLAHDREDALHYVDPPYVSSTRDKGSDYKYEMDDAQHEALADFLKSLKGMVIVSGYHSELYDRLYAGWRRAERTALADGAKKRTEVLWMNYDPSVQIDMFDAQPNASSSTAGE